MYRVSPFTYFVEGILGVAVANAPVECDVEELVTVNAPSGATCEQYLRPYLDQAGGYLVNPEASQGCQFCALDNTNVFLDNFQIRYENRWRNFGLIWVFIIVNVFAAVGFYWLARVVSHFSCQMGQMKGSNEQPKTTGKEEGKESKEDHVPPPESSEPGGK